jgi:homoserine O-succinyltransferase/O-acetyltransferase
MGAGPPESDAGAGQRPSPFGRRADEGPLRIGVINVMPRAETYEAYLLRPLAAAGVAFEPVWIRLASHVYSSSDIGHVRARYRTFDEVAGSVDGLILTGAPVEELAFEDVRYFPELRAILEHAREAGVGTLGLCWGALALGHLLGLPKVSFERKLFGVFEQRRLDARQDLTADLGEFFPCAHSRHSGIPETALERARDAGLVHLLAHGPDTGYSLFESADGCFVGHLGHPEYPAERLRDEWQRDTALGRTDLDPPRHVDLEHPVATWQPHCDRLFANWLARLRRQRTARAARRPA